MSREYGSVPIITTGKGPSGTVIEVRNKEGHSCCLGCCDVRRAVIIVDLIMIGMLLVDIIGLYSLTGQEPFDDDESQTAVENMHPWPGIMLFLFEIVLLCLSIVGAVTFSAEKVAVGLAVLGVGCLISLIRVNLPAVIITAIFAYPHYFLYKEIGEGIMSAGNYHNEEESCCCI